MNESTFTSWAFGPTSTSQPRVSNLGPVNDRTPPSLLTSASLIWRLISSSPPLTNRLVLILDPPTMPAAVSIPPRDQDNTQPHQAGSPMSYKTTLGIPKSFRAGLSPFQGFGHLE